MKIRIYNNTHKFGVPYPILLPDGSTLGVGSSALVEKSLIEPLLARNLVSTEPPKFPKPQSQTAAMSLTKPKQPKVSKRMTRNELFALLEKYGVQTRKFRRYSKARLLELVKERLNATIIE